MEGLLPKCALCNALWCLREYNQTRTGASRNETDQMLIWNIMRTSMRFLELAVAASSPLSANLAALVVNTRLLCKALDLRSNCDPSERSMVPLMPLSPAHCS